MVRSGAGPARVATLRGNLSQSRNVFAEDNGERADGSMRCAMRPRTGI